MLPDFIGIGAQKAGTTWLHRNLQAHPQLYMPRKEVHYFDRKIRDRTNPVSRFFGKRDIDVQWRRQVRRTAMQLVRKPSLRDLVWNFNYYMKPYNDSWYGSVFEPKDGRVAGEITPAYSALDRERVAHVHELVPDAKIIFMMRNPIERAWSQTVMSFDKVEKGSFSSVSEEELFKRIGRNSTYKLSNYLRTFETWGGVLPGGAFLRGVPRGQPFSPCGALAQHVFLPWCRPLVRASAHGEEDPRQVRGHDADEGRRAPGAQLPRGDLAPRRALRRVRLVLALLRGQADREPSRGRGDDLSSVRVVLLGRVGGRPGKPYGPRFAAGAERTSGLHPGCDVKAPVTGS